MQEQALIKAAILEKCKIRTLLTIKDPSLPFGIETEMEDVNLKHVETIAQNQGLDYWNVKDDLSLSDTGVEIASPKLFNTKNTTKQLKTLNRSLLKLHPTFKNCSFQVTFDFKVLNCDKARIQDLAYFLTANEDILSRFSRGDQRHLRPGFEVYSKYLSMQSNHFQDLDDLIWTLYNKKSYFIALKSFAKEQIEAIEFRSANGTVDTFLQQNYITTFYHCLEYVASKRYDHERTQKDLQKILSKQQSHSICDRSLYETLQLKKAIAFARTIFPEEEDQIYFLKQYIGEDSEKVKTLII